MVYLFIVLWLLLTGIMFFAAKIHNKGIGIDLLKVKYEPYFFSGGLAIVFMGLLGLAT